MMGEKVVIDIDLIDLVPKYMENRFRDIEQCRKFLSEDNFSEISNVGHKLKGNARTYGFLKLEEIGISLEKYAHQRNKKELEMLINYFSEYINSVEIIYEQI